MPTPEAMGFPPPATAFPGIDALGAGCRISPSVTVFRALNPHPDTGIFLADEVMLFDDVRLLLGTEDRRLSIGARVIINAGCYVSGEGGLVIGDDVIIGAHARILSAGHTIHGGDAIIARNPITYGEIVIGKGAWIGAGATVLEGVRIGEGAVVGAGSVVTRDVPPFAVAVGNPARTTRYREGFASRAPRWQRSLKDGAG